LEQLKKDSRYKQLVMDEAYKNGHKFNYRNSEMAIQEMGVKYDYSQCNDSVMDDILKREDIIKKEKDERIKFLKTIPIEGIPIAQNIADSLTYPALTTASQTALAAWSGASTLSLNFNRGSKNINLYGINFGSQPSADVADSNLTLTGTTTTANFTGINSRNGSTIIPLTSGCGNVTTSSASIANWRAIYFSGSFNNIELIVKVFGSCYSSNY
jgi:hypothetical protein